MKIGIFDSGLGGLIILKDIIQKLPQYNYIYLGDSARVPYGNRSQETIYEFTKQAVDFLFKKDCQLIIVACNTASAEALRKIQQEWLPDNYPERRVLGVIRPVVEKAVEVSKGKVGVIGTKGTINSESYIREIKNLKPEFEVIQQPTPLLVPLVEEGWQKKDITKKILKKYLKPLKNNHIDTLILGCTHYPILYKQIQGIMGKRTQVLDPGQIVAESLEDYLQRHSELEEKLEKNEENEGGIKASSTQGGEENEVGIKASSTQGGEENEVGIKASNTQEVLGIRSFYASSCTSIDFYVTDISHHYQDLGEQWFGQGIKFQKISLK